MNVKLAVVAYFKVLFRNLYAQTEKIHDEPQLRSL